MRDAAHVSWHSPLSSDHSIFAHCVVEAVTIASVISKWGFVFAADNSSNSLKDDGTWLRLQVVYLEWSFVCVN